MRFPEAPQAVMKLRGQPSVALLLLLLALIAGADAKPTDAAAGQCSNSRRDGTETDIDCGGSECSKRCSLRQRCKEAADCQSSTCDLGTKKCVCPAGMTMHGLTLTCRSEQTTCYNGERDGKEVDVDCGGPCAQLCGINMRCKSSTDCRSGFCNSDTATCGCPPGEIVGPDKRKCIPAPQQLKGAVKDVSPAEGGPSPACAASGNKCALGQQCRTNQDCKTNSCDLLSQKCSCAVGYVQAPNSAGCVMAGDAAGTAVPEKAKVVPAGMNPKDPCWNSVKDGTESDIDCGGTTCWKCALGKSCRQASDCSSLTCDSKSKKCVCAPGTTPSKAGEMCMPEQNVVREGADKCFNGKFDQGEADVDCGGVCKAGCIFGNACKANKDCAAGECNKDQRICMCPRGQFISPDSSACLTQGDLCFNGAKDAEESDVDCGGVCATKCKLNQVCNTGEDCESRVCNAKTNLCGCPKNAPLSKDGSRCMTGCDNGQNPCKNGGTCQPAAAGNAVNFKCVCPQNHIGDLCETHISTCNVSNPCRNDGVCIPAPGWTPGKSGPDFRCYCKAGYSGAMCEVVKSSCFAAASICRNGGTCVPLPGAMPDFRCNCSKGWRGLTCNEKGNAAAAAPSGAAQQDVCQLRKPCQNGGTCTSSNATGGAQGQYTCTCPDGFAGQNCEIVDSNNVGGENVSPSGDGSSDIATASSSSDGSSPASKDASGTTSSATANTTAAAASTRGTCDTESPCQMGDCVPNPGGDPDYTCECPEGYSGKLCEIKQNTCEYFNPCVNGGVCEAKAVDDYADYSDSSAAEDYTCKCAAGFTGLLCETATSAGVTVTATPVGDGVTVTTGIRTSCASGNPCKNGATCMPQPGSVPDYTCTCPPGYSGRLCQTKANTCLLTNPCGNGGTCLQQPGSSPDFRCSCRGGFAGVVCETDCYALSQVPDATGRTCIDAGDLISAITGSGATTTPADACGSGASRKCLPGEPCRTVADCQDSDCKVFPALDNVPRCACQQNSFIFLKEGERPKCVSQREMCSNGARDVYEGDVDCGFYCGKLCGLGQACKGAFGCSSGFCNLGTQKCECQPGFVATADSQTCVPKV